MNLDSLSEKQLQNFVLNQIERVYMLEKGLYENDEKYGYTYDYESLRLHVKSLKLPKGYYKLCKMYNQELGRGVFVEENNE